MESRGDILSVWHGHDHDNDFYGKYHGITIGYGRKTGFGGYGPKVGMQRGSRVFELDCSSKTGEYLSWIRENDGTKVTEQKAHRAGEWKKWTACCGSDGVTNRNLLGEDTWMEVLSK